jgi:ribosomal protein L40E
VAREWTPPPGGGTPKPSGTTPPPIVATASASAATCEKCDAPVTAEAVFCWKCGTKLVRPGTCATCGAPLPAGATYCKKCGAPVRGRTVKFGEKGQVQQPDEYIVQPPRGGSHAAVAAIFIVLTIVLAGLIYTGFADQALGRHFYTGSSAPFSNVTVVGVNGSLTVVVGGVPYNNGSWFVPSSQGFSYCPLSGNCSLFIDLVDPSATHAATFSNFSVRAPFKLVSVPSSPINVGAGEPFPIVVEYAAPGKAGIYWLPLVATATVS